MRLSHLKNLTTLEMTTPGQCTGCGICIEVCPHEVFEIRDRKAVILDKNRCMECGACSLNCPVEILKVNSGVGCASAMIYGLLNRKEPECGCSSKNSCC
jgi:NAD-dependent dihydropyrimidine dehydrogenase PreA subunit